MRLLRCLAEQKVHRELQRWNHPLQLAARRRGQMSNKSMTRDCARNICDSHRISCIQACLLLVLMAAPRFIVVHSPTIFALLQKGVPRTTRPHGVYHLPVSVRCGIRRAHLFPFKSIRSNRHHHMERYYGAGPAVSCNFPLEDAGASCVTEKWPDAREGTGCPALFKPVTSKYLLMTLLFPLK